MLRERVVATAIVEVGGVSDLSSSGTVQNELFELSEDVEHFITHFVFISSALPLADYCKVESIYFPDKPIVKFVCKSQSEARVRELIAASTQPLLDRHAKMYVMAQAADDQRKKDIMENINRVEKMIRTLRERTDLSGLLRAKIFDYESRINELVSARARDEILGVRIRMTELKPENIQIMDRTPGILTWGLVLGLSLLAGAMVSMFSGIVEGRSDRRR